MGAVPAGAGVSSTAAGLPSSRHDPVGLRTSLVNGRPTAGPGRRTFALIVSVVERLSDLSVVMGGIFAARAIYDTLGLGRHLQYSLRLTAIAALAFAVLFVFLLDWAGGYQRGNSLLRIRETERILRVTLEAFLLVFPVSFLAGQLFSRWLLALALLIVPLSLAIEKQLLWHCVRWLHMRGYGVENVLVYGAGFTGRKVFSALIRSPKLGLNPVAMVDDNGNLAAEAVFEYSYRRNHSLRITPGPVKKEMISELGIHVLMIAIPSLSSQRFNEVLAEATAADVRVAFVPQMSISSEFTSYCVDIDGLLISELGHAPDAPAYKLAKRIFDLAGSVVLTVAASPLWWIIALLIWLDSPGPILFSQTRIGRGGKPFRLYKFRSMYLDAPAYAAHPQEAEDPRITRVGRILRRTSLDELPQLINVLKGEMSLVGPRPEMPFIVEQYDAQQRQRLDVIPGITGLWQLSADRAFQIHENLLYDLYYIRHRSFFMDLAILLHTVFFAMRGI